MDIPLVNSYNHLASDSSHKSKKKSKVGKKGERSFKKELNRASSLATPAPQLSGSEELEGLMDDLFKAGEGLVEDPTMNNLRTYKSTVSLFFKYVIKNSLDFDSIEGRLNPKTFERKCYALITVVDKKVDDIARNVLGDQRKQFDLLGAVEEINGLIIDLIS